MRRDQGEPARRRVLAHQLGDQRRRGRVERHGRLVEQPERPVDDAAAARDPAGGAARPSTGRPGGRRSRPSPKRSSAASAPPRRSPRMPAQKPRFSATVSAGLTASRCPAKATRSCSAARSRDERDLAEAHVARRRRQQPGDDAQQAGLARAVRRRAAAPPMPPASRKSTARRRPSARRAGRPVVRGSSSMAGVGKAPGRRREASPRDPRGIPTHHGGGIAFGPESGQ